MAQSRKERAEALSARSRRGGARVAVRRAGLAAAALSVVLILFHGLDWSSTRAYLDRLGVRAPLLLLPYLLVLTFDTLGWWTLLLPPRPPRFFRLLSFQIIVEALLGSLPAGVAVGESVRVVLLRRHAGLSLASAAANAVVVKLGIALAQGIFICGGAALAIAPFGWASAGDPALAGGPYLRFAVAVAFAAAMAAALFVLARGRVLSSGLALLKRLAGARWRDRLARLDEPLAQVDAAFALFRRLPPAKMARALGAFTSSWFSLAFEDWLIFALLGARGVSFPMAVSMQATVSLVRSAFFYLPGGLGAQEASYYGLLSVYGVPNAEAVAVAFAIVKRAKELIWIAVGYLLWALLPSNGRGTRLIEASRAPAATDACARGREEREEV
ncbi:MAG: flippase-like domain-containing protein [Myxococcales bacterium]|nr:flippase-like domain-containing protein [Myxococcales bacterium]